MDENKLTELPTEMGSMKGLEVLTFNDNDINDLPDTLYNLDNLRYGDLISWLFLFGRLQLTALVLSGHQAVRHGRQPSGRHPPGDH